MAISYKVLIVDDEEGVRNLMATLLSRNGHSCETAKDGMEALEKSKQDSFDSAVVDVVMPGMDGITLTRELVSLHPGLPVIVVTGHAHEASAESAILAGAREFIKKPFAIEEFMLRFNKMMKDREGEKALVAVSLTDQLTNLYNRRRFLVLAEQCLKVAVRMKKGSLLLYIDMDNLKWINDHCGHNEGDRALIALGGILKGTFRGSDIVARIGGDEFVVLLESTDADGQELIDRFYENIKDYNAKVLRDYKLSASVGVARFDAGNPIPIDELLSRADASMYEQKRKREERKISAPEVGSRQGGVSRKKNSRTPR